MRFADIVVGVAGRFLLIDVLVAVAEVWAEVVVAVVGWASGSAVRWGGIWGAATVPLWRG